AGADGCLRPANHESSCDTNHSPGLARKRACRKALRSPFDGPRAPALIDGDEGELGLGDLDLVFRMALAAPGFGGDGQAASADPLDLAIDRDFIADLDRQV